MNDIKLKRSGDGTFDWNFKGADIERVMGDQQLISAVVHSVLLRENELVQGNYVGLGSTLYNDLLLQNTSSTAQLVEADIEAIIRDVDGIFDADVSVETRSGSIVITRILITKENGGVFEIGLQN